MIYTFYSYKGGVGRSMALANLAEIFFRAGLKVLMVDWDLEAPGLERFFSAESEIETVASKPGVMEMLLGYKKQLSQEFPLLSDSADLPFEKPDRYIINMYPGSSDKGKLWLLSAGKHSKKHFSNYANSVLTFDWQDFYQNWEGARYFEWLRQHFLQIADVVLIDSRTGVTEMGGVCTYQFADVIIMLCAANQQNLEGTYEMLLDFKDPRVQEIRKRPLETLVVPARIENSESDYLNEFQTRFLNLFTKFTPSSLALGQDLFDQLSIPYSPRYAYREMLAVREKNKASARKIVDSFNRLAFAMSRLAPKEAAIRLALPETELTIGGETLVSSVIAGDVVVTGSSSSVVVEGHYIGRDMYVYELADEERAYLDWLLKRYEYWNTNYIPLAGVSNFYVSEEDVAQLNLPSSFIPRELLELSRRHRHQSDLLEEQVLDVREPIEYSRRILLLGDPGSGKSTTLWKLAYDYAKIAQSDPQAPLPIVSSLGDYADDVQFDEYLSRQMGPLKNYMEIYRSTRGLVLLIDGLNEIPDNVYSKQVKRIKDFLAKHPDDIVVISCRTIDYKSGLSELSEITISGLNEQSIRKYLLTYLGENEGETLFKLLTGINGGLAIGSNPYMLLMIAQIYSKTGNFPQNLTDLTGVFVETLLTRELYRKTLEQIDLKTQKTFLESLARTMQNQGSQDLEIASVLENATAVVPDHDPEQLLYLATSASLLSISNNKVRFTHELFQEYFTTLDLNHIDTDGMR